MDIYSAFRKQQLKEKGIIHLQGLGKIRAKPAHEFKIGEVMVWNYGGQERVIGIKKATAAFTTFIVLSENGQKYERRLKHDRLVGIGG